MPMEHRRSSIAAPASGRWPRRAAIGSAAAAVATLAVGGRSSASTTPPTGAAGGGFAAPEDAVGAYLAGLADGDFDAAVAAWAVDDFVARFDLGAHLEYVRLYLPSDAILPLPNSDPFNVAINVAHRRGHVARMITDQYFALAYPALDRGPNGRRIDDDDVERFVADFEAAMTPAPLADVAEFELIDVAELDESIAEEIADERFAERHDRFRQYLGADELTELAVRTSVHGGPVVLLLRALRYDDAWWLETIYGSLASMFDVTSGWRGGIVWPDGVPASAIPSTDPAASDGAGADAPASSAPGATG